MKKAIIILILLWSPCVFAASYYVDADAADDTGTGAIDDPWKTINKANTTVAVGDTVYFQKGDTWQETWVAITAAPSSEGERITYSAYGTGARPIFKQPNSELATTATAVMASKHYFTFNGIAFDGNGANQAMPYKGRAFDVSGDSSNITWTDCEFYNATVDDVGAHGILINSTGTTFLVDECVFHDIASSGVLTVSTGTTVQDSTFTDIGRAIVTTAGGLTAKDNTILRWAWGTQADGAIVVNTSGDDILIDGNTATAPQALYDCYRITVTGGAQTNVKIINNYADAGGSGDYGLYVDASGMSGLVVEDNKILGFRFTGICVFAAVNFSISRNLVTGSGLGVAGTHDAGINLYGSSAEGNMTGGTVANNILDGNQMGIQIWGDDAAGNMDGNLIYNNTILNSVVQNIYVKDRGQNQVIKNNLSLTPGTYHVEAQANAQTGLTLDYNVYYDAVASTWKWGADAADENIADWRTATSGEANSSVTDPEITAAYRVKSALWSLGTDVGLTSDYYGVTQTNPWVGAVGEP